MLIQNAAVSPTGKRAVFEARGDVLTAPAEFGAVVNVTRSSGVAERYPRWSPDGKTLAYWSDRSGEYELTLRPADGTGPEQTVTKLGAGFRYPPQWSPDNKKLAFIDQAMRIRIHELDVNRTTGIDQCPDWIGARRPRGLPIPVVAGLAMADLRAADGQRQQRGVPVRHEGRETAPGDGRLSERRAADLRSGRQVPVLRVGS